MIFLLIFTEGDEMSKFTAGPWINDDFEISSKEDPANLIASLYAVEKDDRGGYYLGDEFKANAKLIAASPCLLEALQLLIMYADDSDGCQYGTLSTKLVREIAQEAIAKALA